MILVDTSMWVDHPRRADGLLVDLLKRRRVAMDPFVAGELVLGGASQIVMDSLKRLPRAAVASDDETLAFILRYRLQGLGVGYVDAHLLASVCLVPGNRVWTRDKRLAAAADSLGVSAEVGEAQT